MRVLSILAAALLAALSAAPVQAQKTPAALQTEINTSINSNGVGAITGPILNGVLNDMAASAGNVLGANTWALAQTFTALPTLSGCTGLVSGNGSLPVACMTLPAYAAPCNNTAVSGGLAACTDAYGKSLRLVDQGGTSLGARFYLQNNPAWGIYQNSNFMNPTEFQVYGAPASGKVSTPGASNVVNRVSGEPFHSEWVDRNFFYLNGVQYRVDSFVNTNQITLSNVDGSAATLPTLTGVDYQWISTTTDTTCNVSGTAVTYVSGQYFTSQMNNGANGTQFYINGVKYGISSFNSSTSLTLSSSAGTLTNASCHADANGYDEVATFRLQRVSGNNEENFAIVSRAVSLGAYPGQYRLQSMISGSGVHLPVVAGSGHTAGSLNDLNHSLVLQPDGTVGLGGDPNLNQQSLTIASTNGSAATNYLWASGALAGSTPALAARSGTADTNVALGIDTAGTGAVNFTAGAFGYQNFAIFGGNNGVNYLGTGNGTNGAAVGPFLSANGADANINVRIIPKGTGAALVSTHIAGNGSAPAVSTCGTGPVTSTGANDNHGQITTGTGATACTLTFAVARNNTPDCIITPYAGGSAPAITTESTTVLTWTAAASTKYTYHCLGY